jgi:magnesium transporter
MQYGMIAVPVVDDDGRLIGAVPPEALFHILREEHMEDLQRIAGITPREDGDAYALNEPLMSRFRRRIPWLLFGLAASSLVTLVMVGFETSLAANVSVAFFVPALVYIAGAIGSQAVSVAVRRLSLGSVGIVRLVRDETLIGTAIGTTLGVAAAFAVLVLFGDPRLALAVGLAVMAAGTVSAVIGFSLPWAFQRAGFDPALGSGPVCTVPCHRARRSGSLGLARLARLRFVSSPSDFSRDNRLRVLAAAGPALIRLRCLSCPR